jgi:hypothetical protein
MADTRIQRGHKRGSGRPISFFGAAAFVWLGTLLPTIVIAEVKVSDFGKTAEGKPVKQYTLTNANGMVVKLISRGATLTEWHVPDKDGKMADVVFNRKGTAISARRRGA